jgi:tetratricopeptide (TPR) repeat protein
VSDDDREGEEKEEPRSDRGLGSARGRGNGRVKLPARALRALAEARAAARADHARKEGRWLAVVPLSAGALILALMMPRSATPDAIPLPQIDGRALASIERTDDARAAHAEAERLPGYILAVGTAFRALNGLDVRGDPGYETERIDARRRLEASVRDLPRDGSNVEADLLALRAVEIRHFLDAIAVWEATGNVGDDLADLAGSFLERAGEAGWVVPDPSRGGSAHRLLMPESARRVAFKIVWNSLIGVEGQREFTPSLDEERALYGFYLEHPRAPEIHRLGLELERKGADTPEACARVNTEVRRQRELWRADKIKRLGMIDPSYPAAYAVGVAYFRAGRYDLAKEAFDTFLRAHPDGAYALRAKNHLKAAVALR